MIRCPWGDASSARKQTTHTLETTVRYPAEPVFPPFFAWLMWKRSKCGALRPAMRMLRALDASMTETTTETTETIIRAEKVEKYYAQPSENRIQVIAPTDLSIVPGEIVALLGPS